jgi:hypothetical protein
MMFDFEVLNALLFPFSGNIFYDQLRRSPGGARGSPFFRLLAKQSFFFLVCVVCPNQIEDSFWNNSLTLCRLNFAMA